MQHVVDGAVVVIAPDEEIIDNFVEVAHFSLEMVQFLDESENLEDVFISLVIEVEIVDLNGILDGIRTEAGFIDDVVCVLVQALFVALETTSGESEPVIHSLSGGELLISHNWYSDGAREASCDQEKNGRVYLCHYILY